MPVALQPVILAPDLDRLLGFYMVLLGAVEISRVPEEVVQHSTSASGSATPSLAWWPMHTPRPAGAAERTTVYIFVGSAARGSRRGRPVLDVRDSLIPRHVVGLAERTPTQGLHAL